MKKVLSFSLWGSIPRYTEGAIENVILSKKFYPDFECWLYVHIDSVPKHIIDNLEEMSNVKIIKRSGDINTLAPMTWRFETIDNPEVEINMSRDTDTRILLREKLAVDEWISSGKSFHIMRDHPHHMNPRTPIMGGMFGTRKLKQFPKWKDTIRLQNYKGKNQYDQSFLNKFIYPIIKNDCFIHSTFGSLLDENKTEIHKFPIEYCKNFYFVGGYIYEDGSDSKEHTQILIKSYFT